MNDREASCVVPLFAPPMNHLRAGAVWVTISNWADALSARYGAADIVTSAGVMTADAARASAFSGADPAVASIAIKRPRPGVQALAKTLAKDLRWVMWSVDGAIRANRADVQRYQGTPFVWQHHDLFSRDGFVTASRLDKPLVLFVDAPQVWEARRWGVKRPGWGGLLQRLGERPQFESADLVACVTDEVAAQVQRITHNQARTVVTPCTATIPPGDKRHESRSRLDLEGRLVAGWVGSFRRFHHVDTLVMAAAEATRSLPGLTLLLIGDGPTRAESAQLAAELGVDCRFPGKVPNDEVVGLLQACDIGVIPSGPDEAFHYSPLKLKEYLAAGLPTVVPHIGEMARSLRDGVETLFYAPGDVHGLAGGLLRLGRDAHLRQALSAAGQEALTRDFSIDDQISGIEDLLQRRAGRRT